MCTCAGWQQRWFVLDAGILAYYLAPSEVNQGCRGSLKVASCDIHGENWTDCLGNPDRVAEKSTDLESVLISGFGKYTNRLLGRARVSLQRLA